MHRLLQSFHGLSPAKRAHTDARRDVLEWVSSQLVIPLFALPDHFGRFSDAGLGLLCRGEPDQQCSLKKNEEGEGAADRHASPEELGWVLNTRGEELLPESD